MFDAPGPQVLRDYAFLADGHRGALVGPHGDVNWMCFPSWSDPAVFATLVGAGGHYTVQPEGRWVWGGFYEDGSLIWTSRWVTEDGCVESREALAYPGDPARAVLLRRVRAVDVPAAVVVTLDLRSDYGRRPMSHVARKDDHIELRGTGVVARWWGAEQASIRRRGDGQRIEMRLDLRPGAPHDLVLELATPDASAEARSHPPDAEACWGATERAWAHELAGVRSNVAEADVRRSYAVLRGMTGPHGGTVAAATTSLPEHAGTARNYDYRYVWVRDTCYIGRAGAVAAGGAPMLDDAVRWVGERLVEHGAAMAPAYLADGGDVPGVQALELPGYPGGTDVVGNRVRDQFQLDAFGEALLLLASAASQDRLDERGWDAALAAARAIEQRWKEPDAGIWEVEPQHWTHSKLICVAGLRAIGSANAPASWSNRFLSLADAMAATVSSQALHPSGRWQRSDVDDSIDAALLLAEIRGAVPPQDRRSVATREAVVDELTDDDYVYRFISPGAQLGASEGAFLICNFWLSLSFLGTGDIPEARRWFDRARSSAGSPGLLAEEFDVLEHQLRGNLPQAFVHALLIECASRLGPP